MVRVRFIQAFGPYPKGRVEKLPEASLAKLSGIVEVLDAPRPPVEATPDLIDELLQNDLVAERHRRQQAEERLAAEKARNAELEQVVAGYVKQGDTPAAAAPEPVVEPPAVEVEPEPVVEVEPEPVSEPVEIVEEPAVEPPKPVAPSQDRNAAWRSNPVAGLNIPSSIRGALIKAKFRTAGQVADGLDDGSVIAIDGIGEAKAEQLRQHLAALAAV